MIWTAQQEDALLRVDSWLRAADRPYFFLGGFAGTGKTSLARHFAEGIGGSVIYASYTGKAALCMAKAGCDGAQTLHSLLYIANEKSKRRLRELQDDLASIPEQDDNERPTIENDVRRAKLRRQIEEEKARTKSPFFVLNDNSPVRDASLVVVDEASMVGEILAMDLLGFGVPVLVLGDPAQLPPVKSCGYFTKGEPDFMLTDVMRQAKDNPIIAIATSVRSHEMPAIGTYGESRILSVDHFDRDAVRPEQQILVGRNDTRRRANAHRRQIMGRTCQVPEEGDRLVCLRNHREAGLLNGSIWRVLGATPPSEGQIGLSIASEDEDGLETNVVAHVAPFLGEEICPFLRRDAEEFDWGFCLTVHKAQGSQWPEVLVVDESRVFRHDRWRWLYTAVTRASEKLEIVV